MPPAVVGDMFGNTRRFCPCSYMFVVIARHGTEYIIIARTIRTYPTISEGVMEAAEAVLGAAPIFKVLTTKAKLPRTLFGRLARLTPRQIQFRP